MHIIDSDVFIWAIRGLKPIIEFLSQYKRHSIPHLSTITIAEVYQNIRSSEVETTDRLIYENLILPVDDNIAKRGGLYWQDYHAKFLKLSLPDCLIAATARINDLTLVTLNTRHFPMGDITVVNPLKS